MIARWFCRFATLVCVAVGSAAVGQTPETPKQAPPETQTKTGVPEAAPSQTRVMIGVGASAGKVDGPAAKAAAPESATTMPVVSAVEIPETPAGKTLRNWLDAFNSGDRAKIEEYVKTVDPQQKVDGMISFRNQTGGFELVSIESSEPLHVRFL